MTEIRYTLTPAEFREALDQRWRPNRQWTLPMWGSAIVTIGAALMLLWGGWQAFDRGTAFWAICGPLLGSGYFFAAFIGSCRVIAIRRRTAARLYRQLIENKVTILTAGDGALVVQSGETRSEYPLSGFVRAIELKNIFMLFRAEDLWVTVPKRAFATADDAAAFLGLVAAGIAKGVENASTDRGFAVVVQSNSKPVVNAAETSEGGQG